MRKIPPERGRIGLHRDRSLPPSRFLRKPKSFRCETLLQSHDVTPRRRHVRVNRPQQSAMYRAARRQTGCAVFFNKFTPSLAPTSGESDETFKAFSWRIDSIDAWRYISQCRLANRIGTLPI